MEVRLTCCRKIAAAPAVTTREGHRYWNRTIDVRPILHGLDHVTGWCNSWPTEYILFLTFNNYRNVISWKYTESVCILRERSKSVLRKINFTKIDVNFVPLSWCPMTLIIVNTATYSGALYFIHTWTITNVLSAMLQEWIAMCTQHKAHM